MATKGIAVLLASVFILSSCAKNEEVQPQPSSGYNSGTDLAVSEVFTITTYPAVVEQDGGDLRLVYRVDVGNATKDAIPNLNAQISPSAALDQYLAAGIHPSPETDFDIAPDSKADGDLGPEEGRGIEINDYRLLSDPQFIDDAGLDYKNILNLGSELTLTLKWDDKEEEHIVDIEVTDPDNLLP